MLLVLHREGQSNERSEITDSKVDNNREAGQTHRVMHSSLSDWVIDCVMRDYKRQS